MKFAVALACISIVNLITSPSFAVLVTPGNMNGWQVNTYDSSGVTPNIDPTYAGTFVIGPATPPVGTGSFRMQTGVDGGGAVKLQTSQFNGTLLSAITQLSYSTYVATNSGGTSADDQQAPYVQIPVDYTGDGAYDDRLFFEPVYQTGTYGNVSGAGPVPDQRGGDGAAPKVGIWETYDILNGGFWTESGGVGGPPLDTIAHFLTLHPTATIVNRNADNLGLQFVAGFGGPGDWGQFDGNVDNVTFATSLGSTNFDFETAAVPEPTAFLFGSLIVGILGCAAGGRRVVNKLRKKAAA